MTEHTMEVRVFNPSDKTIDAWITEQSGAVHVMKVPPGTTLVVKMTTTVNDPAAEVLKS